MKATIKTEVLRDAINKVSTIKVNRQLPALSYTLLSVKDHIAKLTTTDLTKTAEVNIPTEDSDDLSVLLPTKRTQTFLYGKDGNTSIELDSKGLVNLSRMDVGELQFKPYKTTDFPLTPAPNEDMTWVDVDAKWLCQVLGILLTACAHEESRPILTGVVFSDGSMASADGFRLVNVKHEKAQFGLGDKQVVISYQTLELVKRLFGKEDKITIGFHHPDMVFFKSEGVLLTSQIIQDNYPNWKVLIPAEYYCRVSFSSPLMTQRLRMIDPEALTSGVLRLQFQRTKEHNEPACLLTCGIKDEDYTEYYSMKLPVNIETKEESKIAFNYKYLCDAIKPFSVCNLELNSPSSPGKFTGDVEGLTVVVMPMYVQW